MCEEIDEVLREEGASARACGLLPFKPSTRVEGEVIHAPKAQPSGAQTRTGLAHQTTLASYANAACADHGFASAAVADWGSRWPRRGRPRGGQPNPFRLTRGSVPMYGIVNWT